MVDASDKRAGRTVLVTGATSGIGRETARALAARGDRILVGARDAARGREVVAEIEQAGGRAELFICDLTSFASVREGAAQLTAVHPSLDVLVNNAGIVTKGRETSRDGHEVVWQTNFLSAFLLTKLLLPALRRAPGARVVNVSSQAHRSGRLKWEDLELERSGFAGLRAYSNTKLALVLFTRELARREPSLAVNAVHPGVIATNIWKPAPAFFVWLAGALLTRPKKGAEPIVRLAASPEAAGVTGRYFNKLRAEEPAPSAKSDADAARLWEIAEAATA